MTMLSGGVPLIVQESGKAPAEAKAKPRPPSGASTRPGGCRNYFGQLGLSDDQKESIYQIRAKHQPRIDELEKQLDDLKGRYCPGLRDRPDRNAEEDAGRARAGATERRTKRTSGSSAKPQD